MQWMLTNESVFKRCVYHDAVYWDSYRSSVFITTLWLLSASQQSTFGALCLSQLRVCMLYVESTASIFLALCLSQLQSKICPLVVVMLVLLVAPFTASYSCKSIYMAATYTVWPDFIENFYQISASSFLALYEINETDLICYWYNHHWTTYMH